MERQKSPRTNYRVSKKRPSKRTRCARANVLKRYTQQNMKVTSITEEQLPTCDNIDSSCDNGCEIDNISTSDRKLKAFSETKAQPCESLPVNYTLVHVSVWQELVKKLLCSECHSQTISVEMRENHGFSTKLVVKCKTCDNVSASLYTSPRVKSTETKRPPFDVNKCMVEAFCNIGKGSSAVLKFSKSMGMHALGTRPYAMHMKHLVAEGKNLRKEVVQMAEDVVRKAHSASENEVLDIAVSYDATWQKRGHTSNYGVGFVIDIETGVVVDFEILSKFCYDCSVSEKSLGKDSVEYCIWKEGHASVCQKNYNGSSNSMEKEIAEILWRRSVNQKCFRYTVMLSDGDAKTHSHLNNIEVYGPKFTIEKEECVNHVSKRLGTALRNVVKEWRAKGITLGGRKEGSLKDSTIVKLTNYYRHAIVNNAPDVNKMKRAIYATLRHYMSTDNNPQHATCPPGKESWCFYNRQLANGEKPDSHSKMQCKLSPQVVQKIFPVYQRLAADHLLERCTKARTQNPNESLHSMVWKYCPKEVFVSKNKLELGVLKAVMEFNMGSLRSQETINSMRNQSVAISSLIISEQCDRKRCLQSQKRRKCEEKKKRKIQKWQKIAEEEKKKKNEGCTYSAGQF